MSQEDNRLCHAKPKRKPAQYSKDGRGGIMPVFGRIASISQTGPVCPKPILRLKPRPFKFLLQHHRTSHGQTADVHRYVLPPIKNSELLERQIIFANARIFKIN